MKAKTRSATAAALGAILLGLLSFRSPGADVPEKGAGVLDLRKSPYAKLQNIPVGAVTIQDGFWGKRRKVAVEKSIPSIRVLIEEHGYVDNFRLLSKRKQGERKGPVFADTDPYKWIEGVAFFLQSGDYPDLRRWADEWIDDIVSAQEPNGYLATFFVGERLKDRLTPASLDWGHEDYNLGHMLQSAIAFYRATGDRKLLDAARRFADLVIREHGPDKKPYLAGHPVIEMGLIELYRTTGDRRYLDFAKYVLDGDPRINRPPHRVVYTFSGIPFTERTKLQGHAVRAMYACAGAADYYLETGDKAYWKTLDSLWHDMVSSKMYVTGGLGARWEGESFGENYELPNSRSYSETCAAIGSFMWQWRMLSATGDARFADTMERQLYNAINVGMSLDGTLYCYANPLESPGRTDPNWHSKEGTTRNPWYDVLCCPPNIQRTLGSLPGYFYSSAKDGVYVHFYDNSDLNWHLADGTGLRITQKTNYPWEGEVDLTVDPAKPVEFTLYVRIPGWAPGAKVTINDEPTSGVPKPGSYLPLRRQWKSGDHVRLELDMTPQLLASHPLVHENAGKVALQRGPIVYALEQLDQPEVKSLPLVALVVGPKGAAEAKVSYRPEMLGGVAVVTFPGVEYETPPSQLPLYRPIGQEVRRPKRDVQLTFIPYYAWANREPSPMRVWVDFETK